MALSKLNNQIKIFIIQQLAMFEKPQTVRLMVKENFDLEISLQAVLHYDITNIELPPKWKEIFGQTREKFLSDVSLVPIANKAYRLKELQKMYDRDSATKMQNQMAMRETLEQAAKESGDAYTNRQKVEHSGDMKIITRRAEEMTDDELAAAIK